MRLETLDILRCPYCGGRVRPVEDAPIERRGDGLETAILGCVCSRFPVLGGIAIMTAEGMAYVAREQVERGDTDAALHAMLGLDEEEQTRAFLDVCAASSGNFAAAVDALGPEFEENRYFLYRFSDPTFVVADAVVRALGDRLLAHGGRAVDLCGGSGHLTRSMHAVSQVPPVLMDWLFPKLWLARSFTAPAAELVLADAHTALPFAPGAFRLAVCSDAFHYIWAKALLAREMMRLVDRDGAVALTHAHNALQKNPSDDMPLPAAAYRETFEGINPRVFSERALLADVLRGTIDLSSRHDEASIEADPAITLIGSHHPEVFARHPTAPASGAGRLRINPLYQRSAGVLRLQFPSAEYADEYAAARTYLPDEVRLDPAQAAAIRAGQLDPSLRELLAHRIVLVVPDRYL